MTAGELRDLIRYYNPAVVFLCETLKKGKAMERLMWSLGLKNEVVVDYVGRSEGVALWWRDNVQLMVRPWC